jgi:hypothetical protein
VRHAAAQLRRADPDGAKDPGPQVRRHYARLYDGTVAADYYRAMGQIEAQIASQEAGDGSPTSAGQLLALVDALRDGTLNENQRETVQALRDGILALAGQEETN